MSERYYLNNMSNAAVTITLSAQRVIEPNSSLPLNNKDVMMFKVLRAKRAGKASMLDNLRLSKIRIEDSTNYVKAETKIEPAKVEEQKPAEPAKVEEQKPAKEEKSKNKKEDKHEDKEAAKNQSEEDKAKAELEASLIDKQLI